MTTELDIPGERGYDWTRRRREVLRRDDHACRCCGIAKDDRDAGVKLQVHHLMKGRTLPKPDARVDLNLATLCYQCHLLIEDKSVETQLREVGRPKAAKIIAELSTGRWTVGYLQEVLRIPYVNVHSLLRQLERMGLVERVHAPTGVYELVDDPR